ncbi:MAG: hypothetical protein LBO63_05445 [Oscillospiraceae bacterium]|nr:hypothetical protein [Oscillospiraceae bacterium]
MLKHRRVGRQKKLSALILCAVFSAALLLSASYILTFAEHDHDHDGADGACLTCAHVISAAKILVGGSGEAVKATAAFACVFAVVSALLTYVFCVHMPSPIELKVKITA